MVCYAITVARTAPERMPARIAHPVLRGVGDGGLRAEHPGVHLHRPADPADSRRASEPADRGRYFAVAGAVLVTVIVVRLAWHMSFNAVDPLARPPVRLQSAAADAAADGRQRPGHLVGRHARHRLAGRGAGAAGGFPYPRPDRADGVLRRARHAGDPGADAQAAAARARPARRRSGRPASAAPRASARCRPGWRASSDDRRRSPTRSGRSSRRTSHDTSDADGTAATVRLGAHAAAPRGARRRRAQAVLAMRASDEIGDDAFHEIEEELDWLEMADGNQGK